MSTAVTPGEFARARKDKRVRARRRRLWGWLLVVLVALVAAGLVYLVFFSPVLSARTVEVEGNSLLSAEQVADLAADELGRPLVRVDTDAVAGRVRGLPPVRSVEVSRRWPQTIHIRVTERSVVYTRVEEGRHVWVDADGVSFNTTDAAPSPAVPLAEVKGDDRRLLRDVATVVGSLPKEVAGQVERVRADGVDRISLALSGKRQVVWGSADRSELKAEVLATLLSKVKATTYDVSAPEYPTTR